MPLKTVTGERATLTKGRGATLNPEGRFESLRRELIALNAQVEAEGPDWWKRLNPNGGGPPKPPAK